MVTVKEFAKNHRLDLDRVLEVLTDAEIYVDGARPDDWMTPTDQHIALRDYSPDGSPQEQWRGTDGAPDNPFKED
jgi:hypothetical protein